MNDAFQKTAIVADRAFLLNDKASVHMLWVFFETCKLSEEGLQVLARSKYCPIKNRFWKREIDEKT